MVTNAKKLETIAETGSINTDHKTVIKNTDVGHAVEKKNEEIGLPVTMKKGTKLGQEVARKNVETGHVVANINTNLVRTLLTRGIEIGLPVTNEVHAAIRRNTSGIESALEALIVVEVTAQTREIENGTIEAIQKTKDVRPGRANRSAVHLAEGDQKTPVVASLENGGDTKIES